jgi:hypothetical protein
MVRRYLRGGSQLKFLKVLRARLPALRRTGAVAFSEPPPAAAYDLADDGFEATDDPPPTRDELIDAGILDPPTPPTPPVVPDAPLDGSIAARRRRLDW